MLRSIFVHGNLAEGGTDRRLIRRSCRQLQSVQLSTVVLCSILFYSCGWQKKVTFEEKNTHSRVEIYQPFPINEAGIRVVLVEHDHIVLLLERRADTFLSFIDVYWTPDRRSVAVYSCGSGEIAYDLKARKPIPFSSLRSGVAQHIRTMYQLPADIISEDAVFRWACLDGQEQFLKRYPGAVAF